MMEHVSQGQNKLTWVVVGSSGFVGRGVTEELRRRGHFVREVEAPRLSVSATADTAAILQEVDDFNGFHELLDAFTGADIVVNAAGKAVPDGELSDALMGANVLLPSVLAEAASRARARRFIHVSSAAVQGRKEILDETSSTSAFSPYSKSKAAGEAALLAFDADNRAQPQSDPMDVVVVRATSVQGTGRGTTKTLRRVASSAISSVAAPGTQPSVVSTLESLACFISSIGSYPSKLPNILLQPWEGASVSDVLVLASGGRSPLVVPRTVCRISVRAMFSVGRFAPQMLGVARRLEVLWFGQRQVPGWWEDHQSSPRGNHGPSTALSRVLSNGGDQ